jgi:all-trans-retinol 13,14-reductase
MNFVDYRKLPLDESWDAIVVGSGIGGLSTAALLSRYAEQRVLVLERHYVPGGYTHVFHRHGYEWDVGVHYVGGTHNKEGMLRRLFDFITNDQLEWAAMPDVYDRVLIGDRTYDFVSGVDRFRARLKDYFPGESAAIDAYIKAVQAASRGVEHFVMEKSIPTPIAFLAGGVLRKPFLHWAKLTTADVLRGITTNKELIGVLTAQWPDYGLPPEQSSFGVHALVANHYFDGANYPVGGASRIADTIAPVIARSGGKIAVNAEVSAILVRKNRAVGVRMSDGGELFAKTIVSDVGARRTFEDLLHESNPSVERVRAEFGAIPPSVAHICLYVGARSTASQLGLSGTNLWIHPTFDHDANFRRIQVDPAAPFSYLYCSFPSAKDPDFQRRHPGRCTVEAATVAPFNWFQRWNGTQWRARGADYEMFKASLSTRVQRALEQYVPALSGKIDYSELSTPLSTQHFMNHRNGEPYGLSITPARFHIRSLRPKTPIANLYLTGQDIVTLGVAGALTGGVATASLLLRRNIPAELSKPVKNKARERAAGVGVEMAPLPTAHIQ